MKKQSNPSNSRDRQRVAGEETWEAQYLAEKLNVSVQSVKDAIKTVGHSRDKVEEFIRKNNRS